MKILGRARVPEPVLPPPNMAETHLLAALAKTEAILAAWSLTRPGPEFRNARENALADGLLEVHNRLRQGLPS